MIQQAKDLLKFVIVHSQLYHLYVRFRYDTSPEAIEHWKRAGSPIPPPHAVKQRVVRDYAQRFALRVLIETGTYFGDMVNAMVGDFDRIVSVELDACLAQRAQEHFRWTKKVEILRGDSAEVLPHVLAGLEERALFWLDGHFSSGITARGACDTPVGAEVRAILNHCIKDHVILIDDARDFGRVPGYPALEQLRALVLEKRPGWTVELDADVIRIYPP
jgi:hypothetical protein